MSKDKLPPNPLDSSFFDEGRYKTVEKSLRWLASDLGDSLKITQEALDAVREKRFYQMGSIFAQMRICLADTARGNVPLLFYVSEELHHLLIVYVPDSHEMKIEKEGPIQNGLANQLQFPYFQLEQSEQCDKPMGFREFLQTEMLSAPTHPGKNPEQPWTIQNFVYEIASQFGGAHVDKKLNGALLHALKNPLVQNYYLQIVKAAVDLGQKMLNGNNDAIILSDCEGKIHMNNYDTWYGRGHCLSKKGKQGEAIEALDRAIEIKPTYSAYFARAVAYANLPDTDKAIGDFKLAAELSQKDPTLWNYLGMSYAKLPDSPKAIEAYNKAIELRPNYAEAWYHLGVLFQRDGYPNKAIDAYKKATQFDPSHEYAWNNWGNIYSVAMMPDEAIKMYQEVIRLNPEHDMVWFNYARTLACCGTDKEKIMELLRKAIEITPGDKKCARENPAFQRFWKDGDFIALTED